MATAKIEEREGIVLSRIPQKERDLTGNSLEQNPNW